MPAPRALIIVDVQNDFLPGGPLGVAGGFDIIEPINRLMNEFEIIVATQDWHPANHGSFATNHPGKQAGDVIDLDGQPQILWPVHCVQNTPGAAFAPGLDVGRFTRIFQKGTAPRIDSYSGLFDNGHRKSTGLGEWLKSSGVTEFHVCGIATDFCVKFTALDAVEFGFDVTLIENACRGVDLKPGDVEKAIEQMRAAGARVSRKM
jgi:nicotinamidase/pyrazinamidase